MLKFGDMACYCPCNPCRRKPPEDVHKKEPDKDMSIPGDNGGVADIRPFGPGFTDGEGNELPGHLGPVKQLYSRTGYNLSIREDGTVRGTNELFNKWAVLEMRSPEPGHVRIIGVEANLYLAMDDQGRLHGKADGTLDDTVFLEIYESSYNYYLSKKHAAKHWYVGIKKNGMPKHGKKTKHGQKATGFLPRPAHPA